MFSRPMDTYSWRCSSAVCVCLEINRLFNGIVLKYRFHSEFSMCIVRWNGMFLVFHRCDAIRTNGKTTLGLFILVFEKRNTRTNGLFVSMFSLLTKDSSVRQLEHEIVSCVYCHWLMFVMVEAMFIVVGLHLLSRDFSWIISNINTNKLVSRFRWLPRSCLSMFVNRWMFVYVID
jgi:hypothetical protein